MMKKELLLVIRKIIKALKIPAKAVAKKKINRKLMIELKKKPWQI